MPSAGAAIASSEKRSKLATQSPGLIPDALLRNGLVKPFMSQLKTGCKRSGLGGLVDGCSGWSRSTARGSPMREAIFCRRRSVRQLRGPPFERDDPHREFERASIERLRKLRDSDEVVA
jgi:hypothetical protein